MNTYAYIISILISAKGNTKTLHAKVQIFSQNNANYEDISFNNTYIFQVIQFMYDDNGIIKASSPIIFCLLEYGEDARRG